MANHLQMHVVDSIRTLYEQGWSCRKIALKLGIHRDTVRRHVAGRVSPAPGSKPAKVTPGSGRSRSQCYAHHAWILEQVERGLEGRRIWQDLVAEHGFSGSYQAVKRYVKRLRKSAPHRVWRMECLPGEEAQVDFCEGRWLLNEKGRTRKVFIFRMVLSFSRKAYSEAVLRQNTETFLRCLENAFRSWGGVTATINPDNLKAAVLQADWYDPELNPKLADFARHYGTAIVPTRPKKPEHKGKVENSVQYVQGNALAGRRFNSLAEINTHLRHWEETVADLRIHGTTRQQVRAHFLAEEKPHLKPLPPMLFPCYEEARRQVHRDSFVEVEKAYYYVPCEHIGRIVWAQWDSRMVRVFNQRRELVASHVRLPAGKFTEVLGAQGRAQPTLEETQHYLSRKAARLGVHALAWTEALFERSGPLGVRVVQGLLGFTRKYTAAQIDAACQKALTCGHWRLKQVRGWIAQPQVQPQVFSFLEEHPLIRPMDEYGVGPDIFEDPPPTINLTPPPP